MLSLSLPSKPGNFYIMDPFRLVIAAMLVPSFEILSPEELSDVRHAFKFKSSPIFRATCPPALYASDSDTIVITVILLACCTFLVFQLLDRQINIRPVAYGILELIIIAPIFILGSSLLSSFNADILFSSICLESYSHV